MIDRYTREEMGRVWSQQRKMETWLEVELAATDAWAAEGVVPKEAAKKIREKASFTVEAVEERERTTGHDVAAFVDVVADSVGGDEGRWVHYGLTSSDVLDTALALQVQDAGRIIVDDLTGLRDATVARAREHAETLCIGRTHGVHAEPTTFGLKLAGFAFETDRNRDRMADAFEQMRYGALSGAVGTHASVPPSVEEHALESLGLKREDISTQVIPRDRLAVLIARAAIVGGGLERLGKEFRNLQRTEVREVEEPFGKGQKGSSAMPHKRNPIIAERICGLSRVLRGYAVPALESVALWHERDISHSSAERIILPDTMTALDYSLSLASRLIEGMTVHADRMLSNLELTHGAVFSQRALSALIESGMTRDDAYRLVQQSAQKAWDEGIEFRDLIGEAAPELDLDAIFDYNAYLTHVPDLISRLDGISD